MRKAVISAIVLLLLLPSCSKNTGTTITVVKPKYHYRWYDRKKDKRIKRTKSVRMKN